MPYAPTSVTSAPAPAAARCQRGHPAQLAVAADQRRRGRDIELPWELGYGRLDVQPRVLAQDRVVEAPQLGARLDPDLLDQRAPGVPIGLKRLGLTPAARPPAGRSERSGRRAHRAI
jgi:hypothetical protein